MVSRYRPIGADDFQLKTHSSYDKLSRLSPSNSHVEPDVRTNLVWIHNFSHGVHSTGLAELFRGIYSAQGTLDLLLRQTLVECYAYGVSRFGLCMHLQPQDILHIYTLLVNLILPGYLDLGKIW